MPASRRTTDALVFVVAALVAALPTILVLSQHGGDSSALLRIGSEAASRSFVAPDFDDPELVPAYGHDGQQFYVISKTFPDLQAADGHVDRLRYRARRILFPLLVAPVPPGPPTVWAMLLINLVGAGFAAVAVGRLAARIGLSPWLGATVALSPTFVLSPQASLSDNLALALALWGLVLWRRRLGWAVLLFTLAALAREHTLVAPIACLAVALLEQRRARASRPPTSRRDRAQGASPERGRTSSTSADAADHWLLLVPIGMYLAWSVFVSVWLQPVQSGGGESPLSDALRQFQLPFQTWVEYGFAEPTVRLGILLTVGSLIAAYVLRDRLPELALWVAIEACVLVVAAPIVVDDTLNYARVAPLAVPAMALAFALRWSGRQRPKGAKQAAAAE